MRRHFKTRQKSKISIAHYIAAIILLTSITMCGLLFVNLYGRTFHVQNDNQVTTVTVKETSADTDTSDSPYTVKETEAINASGDVTNDNTKSKLMEDLMLDIAKKTATKE